MIFCKNKIHARDTTHRRCEVTLNQLSSSLLFSYIADANWGLCSRRISNALLNQFLLLYPFNTGRCHQVCVLSLMLTFTEKTQTTSFVRLKQKTWKKTCLYWYVLHNSRSLYSPMIFPIYSKDALTSEIPVFTTNFQLKKYLRYIKSSYHCSTS